MDNIGMNVTVYSGKPPRAHLLDFIQLEDIWTKNNHFLYSLKVLFEKWPEGSPPCSRNLSAR